MSPPNADRPRQKLLDEEGLRPYFKGLIDVRGWARTLRHPVAAMREVVGSGPLFALIVLAGLNTIDWMDRSAFGILLPDIRDHFGMSDAGITSLVALTLLGALLLQLPVAVMADRSSRTRLVVMGGIVWGVFAFLTGTAASIWMLILFRSGAGIGRAVVDPTHNSLLSDYYSIDRRPAVFSFHQASQAVGACIGPLAAGALTNAFGWRAPFLIFGIPALVLVPMAMRLREPVRGAQERRAIGGSEESIETEEPVPSFGEAWRLVWKVEVLRRIWYAIPFLAVAIVGFVSLAGLLYDRAFGLDALERGTLAAFIEPFQLVGLIVGARIGIRLVLRDPALIFRFLRYVAFLAAGWAVLFAWSPTLWVAVLAHIGVTSTLALLMPGLFTVLSMAIPARARAVGFSVASYWAIPGLVLVPVIGWMSDHLGIHWGMLLLTPVLLIGALMVSTGAAVIQRDINDVWTSSSARSQALWLRRQGRAKLLLIKDLNVFYGPVQILFDVSMEVGEGDVIALLGTNGAGKSTLLKAISGIVEADFGAVIFDGRDITHAPPAEIATHGISMMPGGQGVFPSLSVAENLRVATWTQRRRRSDAAASVELALSTFPILAERVGEPAANLSGGQQQQLALAMSLLGRPRLLMVDELSLGLAPVVVEQLAVLVRQAAADGTTVIVVEQSVNVALTLAETAYFMEKGQIRFSGPTAELLDRPDVLRSVFLGGVAGDGGGAGAEPSEPTDAPEVAEPAETVDDTPVLSVRGVSCAFGGIMAVTDVDVDVHRGEIVGVIGPNGAGKTTLFDVISGFTAARGGEVHLSGVDVAHWSPGHRARAGLGRSFQDARLFPSLTVVETIAVSYDRWVKVKDPISSMLRLPTNSRSETAVSERVDALVELFGLGGLRDKFVGELSTGSRRMVDLACVVAHSPSLLLLDEPSSGIAQREAEALGPLIERLRDELGCSILVIEHDMSLIRSVADRLVAMDAGRVIASGPPDEVLADPNVVESYLGNTAELIARSGARAG